MLHEPIASRFFSNPTRVGLQSYLDEIRVLTR